MTFSPKRDPHLSKRKKDCSQLYKSLNIGDFTADTDTIDLRADECPVFIVIYWTFYQIIITFTDMERKITHIPDKWVILEIPAGYKLFATWTGNYLDGDSWRINSGIQNIEQDDDNYYFKGYSGSIYQCHKKAYGTASSYGKGVLDKILDQAEGQAILMGDMDDWSEEINHK